MLTGAIALQNLNDTNDLFTKTALRVRNLVVLEDPLFFTAPGGSEHHHNYEHGLVVHVNEVMSNVIDMTYGQPSEELVTAVIWHDYMKVKDYSLGEIQGMDYDGTMRKEILKNPYRKLINHVAGSAMEFHRYAFGVLSTQQLEYIEHLLLSHHGRKEWGSPVEPRTAEAFILHAADMMSAQGCNL